MRPDSSNADREPTSAASTALQADQPYSAHNSLQGLPKTRPTESGSLEQPSTQGLSITSPSSTDNADAAGATAIVPLCPDRNLVKGNSVRPFDSVKQREGEEEEGGQGKKTVKKVGSGREGWKLQTAMSPLNEDLAWKAPKDAGEAPVDPLFSPTKVGAGSVAKLTMLTHTHSRTHTYTYTRTLSHTRTQTQTHARTHTHIHTRSYNLFLTHTHTYTHVHACKGAAPAAATPQREPQWTSRGRGSQCEVAVWCGIWSDQQGVGPGAESPQQQVFAEKPPAAKRA